MRLEPILTQMETTVDAQLRLADPGVAGAAAGFMEAFRPSVRSALLELAQQAAEEVTAQLGDRRVDVRLMGGDPELVVSPEMRAADERTSEDLEARITLRLPGSLKGLVEDAAATAGDSVNSWVIDALKSRARRAAPGSTIEETFEL